MRQLEFSITALFAEYAFPEGLTLLGLTWRKNILGDNQVISDFFDAIPGKCYYSAFEKAEKASGKLNVYRYDAGSVNVNAGINNKAKT